MDKMCLYYLDGYWSAFGHSAYSLHKLFPKDVDKMIINHREYPFPIINIGIPEEVFKNYLRRHIAYRNREDYLEFKVIPYDSKEYYKWYNNEVKPWKYGHLHTKNVKGL